MRGTVNYRAIARSVILLALVARFAGPAPAADVGIASDDAYLWVYERRSDEQGLSSVRLAYRAWSSDGIGKFRPFRLGSLSGMVRDAAATDQRLHVFFSDGAHLSYYRKPPNPLGVVEPAADVELRFPRGVLPLALTADQSSRSLYAIVTSGVVREMEAERLRVATATADDDDDTASPPAQKTLPGDPVAPCAIVRYELGEWVMDRWLPPTITGDGGPVWIMVLNGSAHVAYRPVGSVTTWHTISSGPDATWTPPVEVPLRGGAIAAWGAAGETPAVVEVVGASDARTARVHAFEHGAWIDRGVLKGADAGTLWLPAKVAFAVCAQGVLMISAGEPVPEFYRWSIEGGPPVENAVALAELAPPPPPAISPTAHTAIDFALLVIVVLTVFVWRRDRMLAVPILSGPRTYAGLTRRLIALTIDAAILAPIWVGTLFVLQSVDPHRWPMLDPTAMGANATMATTSWVRSLLGLLMGLYAIPFELFLGATPGKRIVGCRVLREDESPCRLRHVLARNLCRTVEFLFPPLVCLAFLTAGRQRIGDLVGHTIVVEPLPLDDETNEE